MLFIDLGRNRFTGKIQAWIGMHLTRLVVLSLRSNKFYGGIPENICHLNHIQVLDFSQNDLLGELPKCFNNFSSLVKNDGLKVPNRFFYWEYSGLFSAGRINEGNALLQWKGVEREYTKNLRLLKIIDLSSNKFCGKIPKQVATLAQLVSLNLSRNNLTGQIIQEIGQMKMLESLDLSGNKLSSEIPTSLARLNYLSVLDLSNNNLSGKIPSSTQLQSFNASAYSGNPQLCGLPLPNKCPGEEIVQPHDNDTRSQEEGEEDRFITAWFYISMGLGFAVGFVVVFGTILFSSSSRHAYFQFLDRIHNWLKAAAPEGRRTCAEIKVDQVEYPIPTMPVFSNSFLKEIPKQVATLEEWVSLNLSRNNLTGKITQEMGLMKMLESLDLAGNRLSSEIPTSLARLNDLSMLDLWNNNLSGTIPLSTQLQRFNASVYSGNPLLYGLPLPK
ncbi:receptor-like protein EIX2 [Actinidia eriantha]|uniref:receptor-like protein EIX2 n=1 Tax=Actinidia eriantha TaxID=165200 RepID=UPI0025831CC8|nr:receptor-like protein EIX2 [Actinidia eriantha]